MDKHSDTWYHFAPKQEDYYYPEYDYFDDDAYYKAALDYNGPSKWQQFKYGVGQAIDGLKYFVQDQARQFAEDPMDYLSDVSQTAIREGLTHPISTTLTFSGGPVSAGAKAIATGTKLGKAMAAATAMQSALRPKTTKVIKFMLPTADGLSGIGLYETENELLVPESIEEYDQSLPEIRLPDDRRRYYE